MIRDKICINHLENSSFRFCRIFQNRAMIYFTLFRNIPNKNISFFQTIFFFPMPAEQSKIPLSIGVVRRLLPSTSLWEVLGQGLAPTKPPWPGSRGSRGRQAMDQVGKQLREHRTGLPSTVLGRGYYRDWYNG